MSLIDSKNASTTNSKTSISLQNNHIKDEQISSFKRQYDFKFTKQVEFREMVEQKLKQQINQLQYELQKCKNFIKVLQQKLKNQQNEKLDVMPSCNPLIQVHLKKILQNLQQQHKHCIQTKRQFIDNQQTLNIKINLLEKENCQFNNQIKQLKKKVQSIGEVQNKLKQAEMQIQKLKYSNQARERQFVKQLSQLQKQIEIAKVSNYQQHNFEQKDYQQHNYQQKDFHQRDYQPQRCSPNVINQSDDQKKQKSHNKQIEQNKRQIQYNRRQIEYNKKVKPFIRDNSFSQNYSLLLMQRSKHQINQQNIRKQLQDRKASQYQKQQIVNKKQQISNKKLSDKQIIQNLYKKNMQHFDGQQIRTVDYYDFVKENKINIVDAFYSTRKRHNQTTNKHSDSSNRSTLRQMQLPINSIRTTLRQMQLPTNSNRSTFISKQSQRNSNKSTFRQKQPGTNYNRSNLRQKSMLRQTQRKYQYL